jgi:uncharacterized protein
MYKMFERPYLQELIKRINEPRRFIQVILGPRQVGKTTLVHQLIEKKLIGYHFAAADGSGAGDSSWLEAQWEIARVKMDQTKASSFLLVIDEIQKIDNWSEMAKFFWDADTREKRNLKVIFLGSSRLLLQKGLTESLAGRFESIYMSHWSFLEMKKAFGWNLDQFVWFGGYPGSATLIQDEQRWKEFIRGSLIETTISKDILMITRVDKPALLKRLFELGCLYSGQILSFTKLQGELIDAGNTTTLSHYLDLLSTAGLLDGLKKYAKTDTRRRSSIPKFQVHNTALISAQRDDFFTEVVVNPERWGRMVESAVGAHLINYGLKENFSVRYFREHHAEIDFVIERGKNVVGLEIKSGWAQSAPGVTAFQKEYPEHKILLIGNSGLPWQTLLEMNPVELF